MTHILTLQYLYLGGGTYAEDVYWTVNGEARYLKADWTGDGHALQAGVILNSVGKSDGTSYQDVSSYSNFTNTNGWQNLGSAKKGTTVIGPFTPRMGNDLKYKVNVRIREINNTGISGHYVKTFGLRGVPPLTGAGITSISEAGQNKCQISASLGHFIWDDDSKVSVWANISDGNTTTNKHMMSGWNIYGPGGSGTINNYNPINHSSWFTVNVSSINEQATSLYQTRTIYSFTYTRPSISNFSISSVNTSNVYNFSPQDNPIMYLNINGRRWSLESNIMPTLKITNSNSMTGDTNILSWFRFNTAGLAIVNTASNADVDKSGYGYSLVAKSLNNDSILGVNNLFNANKRSSSYITSTATLTSTHPSMVSSNKSASSSRTFRVQLQPTQLPTVTGVKDNATNTSVQGQTVVLNGGTMKVRVEWRYPHYAGAAGVVSGYKLEVVDSNGVIAYITYPLFSPLQESMSYLIDAATEMTLGKMNYIRITPYYYKPNQSGAVTDESKIILGTQETELITLIKPVNKLSAPVIDFPINNTTWHNKDFRILFTMPEDPNYDDYTSAQKSSYTYGNVQVRIDTDDGTAKIYNYNNTYYSSSTPTYANCFSSTLNGYKGKKSVWLNRTDGDVLTSGTYKIYIRAQMPNYIYTDEEMRDDSSSSITWSDWSEPVTLKVKALNKQNLVKGNKVFAAQYQTLRLNIQNLLSCYPLGSDATINKMTGEFINREEYTYVYNTINNLITGMNNYCTFNNDRQDIKIAYGTKALPSFTALQEIILAADTGVDDNGDTGRNYINILTGYMINCLK